MIALMCMAKNEDKYIGEWVEYHKKLGFDDIFIYCNDWCCNIKEDPSVHCLAFNGRSEPNFSKISQAHNHFVDSHYDGKYSWAAFVDVDEFIVLKKHSNIKDFVRAYQMPNNGGIVLFWSPFGSNGHTEIIGGNYSVLERFTRRGTGDDTNNADINNSNRHVKSILKMKGGVKPFFIYNHSPVNVRVNDTDFVEYLNVSIAPKRGPKDVAQINHYYCKTWVEFLGTKIARGNSHNTGDLRGSALALFNIANQNEVEDLTALNFFTGQVKDRPTLTLLMVDSVNKDRADRVFNYCLSKFEFDDAKLLSPFPAQHWYDVEIEPITSLEAYSEFMIKNLGDYFNTSHCLIIQWDGFIVNPNSWTDDFLSYDYIGSPIPPSLVAKFPESIMYPRNYAIYNGGFSLRSRRLYDALNQIQPLKCHPEDQAICGYYRTELESLGIKFPPLKLARKFAVEYGDVVKDQFGQHGGYLDSHGNIVDRCTCGRRLDYKDWQKRGNLNALTNRARARF